MVIIAGRVTYIYQRWCRNRREQRSQNLEAEGVCDGITEELGSKCSPALLLFCLDIHKIAGDTLGPIIMHTYTLSSNTTVTGKRGKNGGEKKFLSNERAISLKLRVADVIELFFGSLRWQVSLWMFVCWLPWHLWLQLQVLGVNKDTMLSLLCPWINVLFRRCFSHALAWVWRLPGGGISASSARLLRLSGLLPIALARFCEFRVKSKVKAVLRRKSGKVLAP